MPLLQCVERYLLVVLREHISRASSAWSCSRVGTRVPVWMLASASRRARGVVRLLVPGSSLKLSTKLIGWLCGRHLLVVSLFFVPLFKGFLLSLVSGDGASRPTPTYLDN